MKSREGTVVDADDLMDEMVNTARQVSAELGKTDGLTPEETAEVAETVGLGALKYFLLKVDPRKNMTFNPKESIDFNGNTRAFHPVHLRTHPLSTAPRPPRPVTMLSTSLP